LFSLAKNEAKRPPRFRSDSNAVPDSSRNEWSQRPLWLNAAALQTRFYRVKEALGWHHCKIGPEDDRGARGDEVFGHEKTSPNARCRLARACHLNVTPSKRPISLDSLLMAGHRDDKTHTHPVQILQPEQNGLSTTKRQQAESLQRLQV
jgi:hypothetical protein